MSLPETPTAVRVTIKLVEWTAPIEGWDISGLEGGGPVTATWTGDYELRRMDAIYSRTMSGAPPQDNAITTHDFINLTAGVPDDTWSTSDYAQVETAFSAMWNTMKTMYSTSLSLLEYRWYKNGPAFKPHGTESALVERITHVGAAGTAGTIALPPQVAISVTEITAAHYSVPPEHGRPGALRHRWGRFYLPAPAYNVLGGVGTPQEGRLDSTLQTNWANAVQTFYNACRGGANLVPVVYSPTTGNAFSVDEIHMDDIFDVIRRRRYDVPLSRAVRTLDPVTGG